MRLSTHVIGKSNGLALLGNTYVTIIIQGGALPAQARRETNHFGLSAKARKQDSYRYHSQEDDEEYQLVPWSKPLSVRGGGRSRCLIYESAPVGAKACLKCSNVVPSCHSFKVPELAKLQASSYVGVRVDIAARISTQNCAAATETLFIFLHLKVCAAQH